MSLKFALYYITLLLGIVFLVAWNAKRMKRIRETKEHYENMIKVTANGTERSETSEVERGEAAPSEETQVSLDSFSRDTTFGMILTSLDDDNVLSYETILMELARKRLLAVGHQYQV